MRKGFSFLIILPIILLFFIFPFKLKADVSVPNFPEVCDSLEQVEKICSSMSKSDCQSFLEKCEDYFNRKAEKIERDLSKTKSQRISLQNKVFSLKKQVEQLNLQIQQGNLVVQDLSLQINDTKNSINNTTEKINKAKEQIAQILRYIYEKDQRTNLEILLSENKISDFFNDVLELEMVSEKNRELLSNLEKLKASLSRQKESLDAEKEKLERQLLVQQLQKQESEEVRKEKEYLLRKTEGSEAKYEAYLKETKEKAAKIRARIFELIGIEKAPTFGEAVEMAKYVQKITGIRPAFLLAILTQESNIGRNVGQCYVTDFTTGDGKRSSSGSTLSRVMNPKRDIPYFLKITKSLGRDPSSTLVSCPLKYGWGGAMGPAQFIPSTWVYLEPELRSTLGREPDPWSIKDSFLAAGLYLKKLGGAENEWRAAMRYFSGSSWSKYEEFYGNSVLRLASKYQKDIDAIER